MYRCVSFRPVRAAAWTMLALLTAALPFAAPEACAQALGQGLRLCGGPLLLSLFPFLIVSTLLARSGGGEALGEKAARWLEENGMKWQEWRMDVRQGVRGAPEYEPG